LRYLSLPLSGEFEKVFLEKQNCVSSSHKKARQFVTDSTEYGHLVLIVFVLMSMFSAVIIS